MSNFLTKILIFQALIIGTSNAKDLGIYGHTFPILEKSLSQYLQDKIKNLSEKDRLDIQKKIQDQYISKIKQPKALNLPEAKISRIFYYDPTIYSLTDIKNIEGEIVVPKGTSYNPLKTISLNENLLFFDGSNLKHLAWAKQNSGKWILTKGKPIDLEESEKRAVFFDQMGKISNQLGILSIPARVSQEDLKLKIEEIPCL